jgi:hypothetical protein
MKNNPLLKGASGMLGEVVVYRELRGKVIMANKPKPPSTTSEKQLTARVRFRRAAFYAKRQMENPEAKALYTTGINDSKVTAFLVALTDYLKAPVIQEIDASGYTGAIGQAISITATDDFKVKSVQVAIVDPAGAEIEHGEATPNPEVLDEWQYVSTTAHPLQPLTKVIASVRDVAGNVTTAELLKGLQA